jgi:pimeloyl-ACP methyl ester carboxylesterase
VCRKFLIAILLVVCGCQSARPQRFPALAATSRLPLELCNFEGTTEPLLCGVFNVYENRETQQGRVIPIKVVVIPAQEGRTTNSAWIEHQGGPRYSMVANAPQYAKGGSLESFRRNRDIVLIDPRGLHESGALYCEALKYPRVLEQYYTVDRVRACREELEQHVDLKQYSTLNAIDDFEDIRKWLGYEQWDVGGWSFGSRFMLTYIHRYPDSIRTASLFIPSTLNFERPIDYARFGQQALDRLIVDCQADTACDERFPNIAGDLEKTLAALRAQPEKITFVDPYTHEQVSKQLTSGVFAEVLWTVLFSTESARGIPFILYHSARGDYLPFLAEALSSPSPPEPEGHYFSVVCPEETGRLDRNEVIAAAKGTFVGSYIVEAYIDVCKAWDLPNHPEHPIDGGRFDIPALIVTGDQDPVTPPQYGDQIATHFENAVHITVPHMAHGTAGMKNSNCLDRILADFVTKGSMEGIDRSCVKTIHPPPFRLK